MHCDKDIAKEMSTGNSKNSDEPKLKELRVAIPKMKVAESQCQPSTSSQAQEDINPGAGEQVEKKLPESDKSKSPRRNKNVVSSGDLKIKIRKSKIKPNPPEGKEKEPQKSAKSGGQEVKTRTTSRERKNKTEPDKSPSKKKEKGNTPKDKAKEKRVSGTQKEKKTPKKAAADDSQESKDTKELLREDPTLPPGWRRIIKGKHVGTELKPVVCIASPEGRKFYFKARLMEYLEKTNSHLSIDDFYFGLYKRSEQERAETNSANSVARKAGPKKTQEQKRSESVVKGRESKKIRLDSGSNPKKAQPPKKGGAGEKQKSNGSSDEGEYEAGDKNLLLEDPNLPEGWIRQVLIKNDADGHNKIQVWIISPDGKKFQRKHMLEKYLQKTKSTLDIDQFYFGIYPRRDEESAPPAGEASEEPAKQGKSRRARKRGQKGEGSKKGQKEEDKAESISESLKNTTISSTASKSEGSGEEPMLEDPNLPPGWRRFIKVRSAGESAGRMEVIIASPDGKRHRSKGGLEQYIKQKGLDLNVEDFDFTVFGKNSKRYNTGPAASTPKRKSQKTPTKKKGSASRTPGSGSRNTNRSSSPENMPTREAAMINYVSALMLSCGLRDLRTERRLRVQDQEKVLKNYLDSLGPENVEEDDESSEIPSSWVKKLALCRSDFGKLEDDAAETIASLTKDFVVRLAQNAVKESGDETKLEYNQIADIVDKCDNLAPMRTLIPKKITYKEYLRLNRPTKYTSFT